ncbi:hypothetical protein BCR37DRAFT_392977 [Protomyces lactucae-debilis]|uniref:Uncharacterized protein n=1 Tax=Protomyces lactucae-debilis TaxID=2754530 RepID=A0A1Y2FDD3_PROLT|nr:uncharacterized protein BCR37DRAFT_392977 [Protomyces lactucae-debilis]ORY81933.1 hypothetical protein BCR37DRAFT_392977 [Protomyces lactucae-debilis]
MHFSLISSILMATIQMTCITSLPLGVTTIVKKEDNSTALETFLPPADNVLSFCKGAQSYYDAGQSDCFERAVCTKGKLGCGDQCYDPAWYKCLNNVVYGSRGDPLLKNATDVQVQFAKMMESFELRR